MLGGLVGSGQDDGQGAGAACRRGRLRLSVELCAIYWHFLLLVWLVLFALLARWADDFVDICRQLLPRGATRGMTADLARPTRPTALARPAGWRSIAADWSSDQRAFKNVSWGKAMMWIFLLSDTFIFSCFLISYMTVRMSTTVPWPNPSEVFALTIGGTDVPLILIAIMTFVLISSSGTMAMAVNFGYRRDRVQDRGADAGDRGLRRDLRRHAGVRMDQADPWRACGPGAIPGARRSSARPSS